MVDATIEGNGTSVAPTVDGVIELGHLMADELAELTLPWNAALVPDPRLVVLNRPLAVDLGLDADVLSSADGVAVLAGNLVPQGATPVALAYAGHQFGSYSPLLGDGRALLLGELEPPGGGLRDLHLKGSGRTPFARGGDGKATVGSMLREYLISEFLHRVGVPTTRSLAVVTTGEQVTRDRLEPGAVLTRVAASHIRVGTFEYAARTGGPDLIRRLADHVISRHHPHAGEAENPYLELLRSVVDAQAVLVAKWMTIGFIHGVMNTDNMTISGEGIDYGPCAFMDTYDPSTVFSSIDHAGRYAYGNQVRIAAWNLARLAETMLVLLADDVEDAVAIATDEVNAFVDRFRIHWDGEVARKLGLDDTPVGVPDAALIAELAEGLITVMEADRLDWTLTFRDLASGLRSGGGKPTQHSAVALRGHPDVGSDAMRSWTTDWHGFIGRTGRDPHEVADRMDSVNPVHIPRNHLVDEALASAADGDTAAFFELLEVLEDPFGTGTADDRYSRPASAEFSAGYRTFCGT